MTDLIRWSIAILRALSHCVILQLLYYVAVSNSRTAQHLDTVDLARCVQVGQLSSEIVTPTLWAIFDDHTEP